MRRLGVTATLLAIAMAGGVVGAASIGAIEEPARVERQAFRLQPAPPAAASATDRAALEFVEVLNEVRRERGMVTLFWHDTLGVAAQGHAEDMALMRRLSHTGSDGSTPSDRMEDAGWPWNDWGESIASGYATPAAVLDGWLGSPPHATYLIGDFSRIGVGVASTPDNVPYWVVIVANEHNQLIR